MSYQPTNWSRGDVITSAKLNKIEQGIASGGVLVATDTEGTLAANSRRGVVCGILARSRRQAVCDCRV